MTAALMFGAIIVLTIALLAWGRWVWRKHEREAIYEADPRSESHKKDPFFLSRFISGGGPGPG